MDWVDVYFAARVILGLSEEEFWQSTPKQLTMLFERYAKWVEQEKTKAPSGKEALEAFMSW